MKLSIPHINKTDIHNVSNTLKSGWVSTSSKTISLFEKNYLVFVKQNIVWYSIPELLRFT